MLWQIICDNDSVDRLSVNCQLPLKVDLNQSYPISLQCFNKVDVRLFTVPDTDVT